MKHRTAARGAVEARAPIDLADVARDLAGLKRDLAPLLALLGGPVQIAAPVIYSKDNLPDEIKSGTTKKNAARRWRALAPTIPGAYRVGVTWFVSGADFAAWRRMSSPRPAPRVQKGATPVVDAANGEPVVWDEDKELARDLARLGLRRVAS